MTYPRKGSEWWRTGRFPSDAQEKGRTITHAGVAKPPELSVPIVLGRIYHDGRGKRSPYGKRGAFEWYIGTQVFNSNLNRDVLGIVDLVSGKFYSYSNGELPYTIQPAVEGTVTLDVPE